MRPARRSLRVLLPLALVAIVAAGCASVASPEGWARPEVDGNTLYVSLSDGRMSALDAETFQRKWRFPEDDTFACGSADSQSRDLEGIYGAPAVGEDAVYLGAYDGAVYAVGKENGTCLWRFETDDPIVGAVVLDGERLYVPSTDGNLYILNAADGTQTDVFPAGDIWSTPLLADGVLYASTMEGRVWALDPETLDEVWDEPFKIESGLLTDPVLSGDTLIVGGIGEKLYGIDAGTGEETWAVDGGNWFWGRPAVSDGRVFATTLGGEVLGVDAGTGERLWTATTPEPIRAGTALAGANENLVVAVDRAGNVFGLAADSGETAWGPTELDASVFADPVTRDDAVMVVSRGGDIIQVDSESGVPTTVDVP